MSTQSNVINLMIDIETASTDNNAAILACAIVPFMWDEHVSEFYEKASLSSNEAAGFHISRSTMEWWEKQDVLVRAEAFSGTQPVVDMLNNICNYFESLPVPVQPVVWSKGSDFDIVVLTNAFDHFGLAVPWSYKNVRCVRTLEGLFPELNLGKATGAHNALADACHQAHQASVILKALEEYKIPRLA